MLNTVRRVGPPDWLMPCLFAVWSVDYCYHLHTRSTDCSRPNVPYVWLHFVMQFNRRHHCRRCGRVVCGNCSSRTACIHKIPSRVCDQCFHLLQNAQPGPTSGVTGLFARLSDAALNSRAASYSPLGQLAVSNRNENLLDVINGGVNASFGYSSAPWRLDATDEDLNAQLREDFFYEQAPSPVLAIALLDLHTDAAACGQFVLQICDELSGYLQVTSEGQPNPEVDYPLLIE